MKILFTKKPNVFVYRRFAFWPRKINGHWVWFNYFWTKVAILPAEYLPLVYEYVCDYTDGDCAVQVMLGNFIVDAEERKRNV